MNRRAKKILLLLLAAALLFGAGRMQTSLNGDRQRLGLTVVATLQDAPPMLAFTTVALGGFRGLISNFLWIRANDLQQDDKFFEAAQLADWITALEPHFATVWTFQAWNMAYNISVKFKENGPGDYSDRWRWVRRGIELLRDHGLRYNPDNMLIYQQLALFFQHKMGQDLDDANRYYKEQWAKEMTPFFGPEGTNFESLIHPQTAVERTNALVLKERYKIDPAFAQKVDEEWGPLDWRLPEAHAIYWGMIGLEKAKEHPDKVDSSDIMTLRRVIYQSMQQEFRHGRIIANPFVQGIQLAPNLDIIEKVNDTYLKMYAEEADQGQKDSIQRAQRNFVRDAVYFLYVNNRTDEAAKWFKYLGQTFPDKPIIEGNGNPLPKDLTLEEYAFERVQGDVGESSPERVTAAIMGLLQSSYLELAIGQDNRFAGFQLLARNVYDHYYKLRSDVWGRVGLPPLDDLKKQVLNQLLNPQEEMIPYAARAVIRTQLRMPPETNSIAPFAISTNTAPVATTNSAAK